VVQERKRLLPCRVQAAVWSFAMYLQARTVADSDLECMSGERQQEEQDTGRKCGWQCAAAVFVLGLVMVTAFSLKGASSTGFSNSAVTETVQMESMQDPVWKEVLGHKAFEQFEKDLDKKEKDHHEEAVSTTIASTTLATETTAPHPMTTPLAKEVVTAVLTAAPTIAPVAPLATPATTKKAEKLILFSGGDSKSPLDQIAEEFMDEAGKLNPDSEEHKSLASIGKMLSKVGDMVTTTSSAPPTPAPAGPLRASAPAVSSPLAPHEALKDGNKCPSDEEESEGTCFKKCYDLTGGYYPIRTSAFSCCAAEPCSFFNSKIHVGFCSGFDVSGDAEGDGCPSFEGACLVDEEMFGGLCYKKCSLFPDGPIYSTRVAPNVCCSKHGFMCLLPKYFKFSMDFAVGGGKGDGNAQTPAEPHLPMKQLTEMDA